ncbi:MAG: M13 family peptidase, partial [Acidobacteriaceae bacterium]|nr:M13 family peptidase [Acidobacteriaceae bacterium]
MPICVKLALFGICMLGMAQSPSPSSGVELKAIDKSVDPCQDFYRYACGAWMKANSIPAQYAVWGRFQELADRNQQVLHEILEDAAKHQQRSTLDQKTGAFYASCMDEGAVDKAGAAPIKPEIDRIRALKDKSELSGEVARLHNQAVGVFFSFRATPDQDQSTINIANLDQGGLGLPDRSYYLEAKDEKTRQEYLDHISKMFQLVGDSMDEGDVKAKAILKIETAL